MAGDAKTVAAERAPQVVQLADGGADAAQTACILNARHRHLAHVGAVAPLQLTWRAAQQTCVGPGKCAADHRFPVVSAPMRRVSASSASSRRASAASTVRPNRVIA